MGKYLTTNLNTYIQYDKKRADKKMAEKKSDFNAITDEFIGDRNIFEFHETKEWYLWELKPTILENNIHHLLKSFYSDIYGEDRHYSDISNRILTWLEKPKTTDEIKEYFKNGTYSLLYFRGSWDYEFYGMPRREFYLQHFMLSSSGKIVTEGIYNHLHFFNKLLREKYKENPLAACLNINIWG